MGRTTGYHYLKFRLTGCRCNSAASGTESPVRENTVVALTLVRSDNTVNDALVAPGSHRPKRSEPTPYLLYSTRSCTEAAPPTDHVHRAWTPLGLRGRFATEPVRKAKHHNITHAWLYSFRWRISCVTTAIYFSS